MFRRVGTFALILSAAGAALLPKAAFAQDGYYVPRGSYYQSDRDGARYGARESRERERRDRGAEEWRERAAREREWREHEWRQREWREHEWRERYHRRDRYDREYRGDAYFGSDYPR